MLLFFFSSEGNCQLLHERLTAVKKERDTIETDSRAKIGTLSQNLKELQTSSKTLMEQFRVQTKQCEHLDTENKQLTEYVVRENTFSYCEFESIFV